MAKSDESRELKTYYGNCHCGLFRFHLNVAPLKTLWTCNCSICTRNGYLWIHPVADTQFVIDAGKEKALHSYQFAMRGTTHLFCPECGSSIMARRRESLTDLSLRINARMLDDLNLDGVEIKSFSGAETGPKYDPLQQHLQLQQQQQSSAPKQLFNETTLTATSSVAKDVGVNTTSVGMGMGGVMNAKESKEGARISV